MYSSKCRENIPRKTVVSKFFFKVSIFFLKKKTQTQEFFSDNVLEKLLKGSL